MRGAAASGSAVLLSLSLGNFFLLRFVTSRPPPKGPVYSNILYCRRNISPRSMTMAAVTLACLLLCVNAGKALTPRSAPAAPSVAVFGGTGYIGSRVVSLLSSAGCDVVSVSRAECPPMLRTPGVSYLKYDLLSEGGGSLNLPRRLDAAVSLVGNMRPAAERDGFFGLHWNNTVMEWENGLVTERVAFAAKEAGARRLTYVSISGLSVYALGGGLEVSVRRGVGAVIMIRAVRAQCGR